MPIIRKDEIQELFEARGPCVSLYLPTVRAGAQTEQNPIRFKNLLRSADGALEEAGVEDRVRSELLFRAQDLVEDYDFWQHQRNGLAYLASEGTKRLLTLPHDPGELAVASGRFHLKPLLPLIIRGGRFYILALSRGRVRLFEATPDEVSELDLGDALPENLADALGYDWEQRSLQFRGQTRHAGARSEALYHGQGAGSDDREPELQRFLEILDNGLGEALPADDVPMVLAGVEEVTAMFRQISKYPRIVEDTVRGNADEAPVDDLHRDAWSCVEPVFDGERKEAAGRIAELLGTDRATEQLGDIVRGAHDGRVDTIFVRSGEQVWGHYDRERRFLERTGEAADVDSEDLLDLAAMQSLATGASVFAVPAEDMPGEGEVAALFRY